MNVLVIGSGGREHALVYALNKSSLVTKIFVCPGNGGLNNDAELAPVNADDFAAVASFCKDAEIGLVVVGPEAPLVEGIADYLTGEGINVFGPSKAASQIEGSKDFMKAIAKKYGVPTAEYATFSDEASAIAYVEEKGAPIVVKTDGLAAGKGVTVAQTVNEAVTAIKENFAGRFGNAGKKLVIEEFLSGEEASFFAICDGKTAIPFGSAQDHKAVGEGDTGPNTGGMGTYSPAPVVTPEIESSIFNDIVLPVIEGMARDGVPYQGVLFAGVMIGASGPKLIEFNIRFGDPEAQVLMQRLKSDILPILLAASEGKVSELPKVEFDNKTAICVVMAANGYPGSYKKNTPIHNVDAASAIDGVMVYHAGTKLDSEGQLVANGGRVLGVTSLDNGIIEAQTKAYQAVDTIDWEDGFCRRDIGWRAVERVSQKESA